MRMGLAFAAAAVVVGAVAVWLGVTANGQRQTIERLEAEARDARSRLAQAAVSAPKAAPPVSAPEPAASREPRGSYESTANPEADLLRARLAETRRSLDNVTAQMQQLAAQVKQLTDERTRASGSEAQMRTRLADLENTVTAVSSERSALGKRAAELETANTQLRASGAQAAQRNAQLSRLASDLEDVGRRQQVYVTNILRRYREVTELFRAYPTVVENRGNGPEVSRIQSALQMADEDVRQLNDLHAQLTRVQRQIATAVAVK